MGYSKQLFIQVTRRDKYKNRCQPFYLRRQEKHLE